ncbi:MAG: Eco57I restriction-modification methylase domain-containing protein [Bacteroidetes bacterium]|nr:Eco57I restriction-modification methylase domain-containing protein [Bacteroidota bacterium]
MKLERRNISRRNRKSICGTDKDYQGHEAPLHPFLYMDLHEIFGEKMQFNVIMGNPPYQMQDGGGTGKSAVPLYNRFVDKSKEYKPDLLIFVIPARWYAGGRGLDSFRSNMLSDPKISLLVDYPRSETVFSRVTIAGGVCFFLHDQQYKGDCFVIPDGDQTKATHRKLNEYDVFIRDEMDVQILRKVQRKVNENGWKPMSEVVSPRNFFGIQAHRLPSSIFHNSTSACETLLVTKDGDKYVHAIDIAKNSETLHLWKVIVSKASAGTGGVLNKSGIRVVITKPRVIGPQSICTETYLLIDMFSSREPAERLLEYVKSRFFRFLLSLKTPTHNLSQKCFEFVPALPMDRIWNDEILYDFFDLTDQEIAHIESKIKVIN